jgi:hypothetical protein
MVLELLPLLVVMTIVGVLSLRIVPERWNRVDVRVGLSGLTLSAEDEPDGSE